MRHSMSGMFQKASFLYSVTCAFLLFVARITKKINAHKADQMWRYSVQDGYESKAWGARPDETSFHRIRHTILCGVQPNAFSYKRQFCINNAYSRLKCFRQITKYPECGFSLCTVRLLPKTAGKTACNTSQPLPLLGVQSIPLNTIPNYNFSFPADIALLC
jgi:hypothetical protein